MAAGSRYNHKGGGAEYVCLSDQPEFLNVIPGHQTLRNSIYGVEYEAYINPPAFGSLRYYNVPCAACSTVARGQKIMIPGKVNCTSSWTREYYGYLMTERTHDNHNRMSYICIDVGAEGASGSAGLDGGATIMFTEVYCSGIKCPPYAAGNELPCVVCTK